MTRRYAIVFAAIASSLIGAESVSATFPGANGKVAITSSAGLHTVQADGIGLTTLAPCCPEQPAWSPDGKRIAFADNPGISTMNADGSARSDFSFFMAVASYPAWSPDGQQIAYVLHPYSFDPNESFPAELWVMNADGTGRTRLVDSGSCAGPLETDGPCTELRSPDWSPDGNRIAFLRADYFLDFEETACGQLVCRTPDEVWFVDTAIPGSDAKLVGGPQNHKHLDWSPDGSKLLLSPSIASINVDGTGFASLGPGHEAAWSPDGTKIVYQTVPRTSSLDSDIHVRDANGANPAPLVSSPTAHYEADWQPLPRGYPRPRGASPVFASLVPASASCTAPNRTHGAPLSFPSCAPPAQTSAHLTVGTPDANERGANSVGSVALTARAGDFSTPADEADVRVIVKVTGVRNRSDLTDYTGELGLRLPLQITDRNNTGAGPATVSATEIGMGVPCTASSTNVGATCSAATTVEAVLPGAVTENARTIWELGQVRLDDGGPDGDADTSGNTTFLVQGVFAP